jgi:hypothetical protein
MGAFARTGRPEVKGVRRAGLDDESDPSGVMEKKADSIECRERSDKAGTLDVRSRMKIENS